MPRATPDLDLKRPVAALVAVARLGGDQLGGGLIRSEVQIVEIQRGIVAWRAKRLARPDTRDRAGKGVDRQSSLLTGQIPQRILERQPWLAHPLACLEELAKPQAEQRRCALGAGMAGAEASRAILGGDAQDGHLYGDPVLA